ncbi:MAG TPA: alpha/beta hydrolase [Verrucomicrobiae bacterium]|nr:alpha/beta hydrolase [Verrucomicrobiae bacterium]
MNRLKRNWLKSFVKVLLTLIIIYVLFALLVMFYQRKLIYFPTKLAPADAERIAAQNGFVPWQNAAGGTIGWKMQAKTSSAGTVLIVHGNAGFAADRDYLARPIHDAALVDVFVLEYPGYGARSGSPSEQSFLAAADEAFNLLTNKSRIYVVSESLGAGVAAYLAKTHGDQVSGLLLFMPYNRLVSVAQAQMPVLPVHLLLWDRFDPEDWLKNYHGPVQIVLAERDEVIPTRFGRRLYESYDGPKVLQIIPGARHNEVAEQSTEWWKGVFSFWQKNRTKKE